MSAHDYPCANCRCNQKAVAVEIMKWEPNGMAFYGYCADHLATLPTWPTEWLHEPACPKCGAFHTEPEDCMAHHEPWYKRG